ncbi:MAG TPA: hypothetical protein VF974_04740 [Patescibacteria group bacterium]
MNYNLAKSLKDAGFPQHIEHRIHYRENCEECMVGNYEKALLFDYDPDEFDIAIPTLSELIEACGDKFDNLHLVANDKSWEATGWDADSIGLGQTPEIAVAELWLELNKKK